MSRITDDCGRAPDMLRPWEFAKAKAERQALPFEVIARVAREEAHKRLARQKMTGKPRVSIHPFRNGRGHWYTIKAGKWSIRCKSWYQMVFRAAYGPWLREKRADSKAIERTVRWNRIYANREAR